MADSKTLNIAGHRVNKWVVYGGIGVVVVGGVLFLRRKKGSSGGSSSNGTATDPVTGLPYSMDNQVDPATGLTYLGEAQQYGSVSAAEAAVGAGYGGVSGTGTGYSGAGYGGSGAGSSSVPYITGSATPTSGQYATNADWAQAVIAALPGVTGDSQSDVATAVANYLAGLPLTATQANDIQVALAEFGPPPQPPAAGIVAQGSNSGPTGTGSGSGSGSGSGGSHPSAKWQYPAPQNLSAWNAGKGRIGVSWAQVVGPQGQIPSTYTVAYGRTSGAQTWHNTVHGTSTTLNTQPGMTEYIEVWANGGPVAPPHAGPVKATAGK